MMLTSLLCSLYAKIKPHYRANQSNDRSEQHFSYIFHFLNGFSPQSRR
jgi:hypothetical protein